MEKVKDKAAVKAVKDKAVVKAAEDKNKKRSIRRGYIECTDISMAFIRFSLWQEARSLHKGSTASFKETQRVAHR